MTDYTITQLNLSKQGLTELPTDLLLYTNLQKLWCWGNQLTELPLLPTSLQELYCDNNQLTFLPELPTSLEILYCSRNGLTELPELPASLKILTCSNNELTELELPLLPTSLQLLYCDNNQLKELPELPTSIKKIDNFETLNCSNNPFCNDIDFPITIENIPKYNEWLERKAMRNYAFK